jgi:RNA polymerase sigma factor (sigma-70 family)
LFRYFHGRSTLATWLRAVLAQRHVDRLRAGSRHDPLPDDDAPAAMAAAPARIDPDRARLLAAVRGALAAGLDALAPRDRLRLSAYYAQELTLAQTGRLTGEHEATVSRQLAKTRAALRSAVETRLAAAGFSSAQIAQGLADILDDAGPLDLRVLLPDDAGRKKSGQDRSEGRTRP